MKRLIFIICLLAPLGGCAVAPGAQAGDRELLSFADLANEITVAFEERDDTPARDEEIEGPLGTP